MKTKTIVVTITTDEEDGSIEIIASGVHSTKEPETVRAGAVAPEEMPLLIGVAVQRVFDAD